jgi:hypothetical protein
MKNGKNIVVFIALVVMSFFLTDIGVAVAPTIGEVVINPERPEHGSDVTFSVDIAGDNVSSVWLVFKECKENLCYKNKNISMTKSGDRYEANVTLENEDATYITYHIEVNSNGEWFHSESVNLTLAEKTDGNQNGNNNGNTDKGTPGFELVLFIVAVGLATLLLRKKRLR